MIQLRRTPLLALPATALGPRLGLRGAIGFTWQRDLQLFFKWASSCVPLLGSPEEHREALAAMLLGHLQY